MKRALLHLREGGLVVWVDIVEAGRVRLRVATPSGTHDLLCDTLEELPLLALEELALTGELYEQLCWELDLMGKRE